MRQASPFALALLAATSLAGSPAFAQEDAATSAALERLDAALPTDERINTLLAQMNEQPGNLDLFFEYAQLSMQRGEFAHAVDAYSYMLKMVPSLDRIRLELAVAYMRLGRFDEARALLEELKQRELPGRVKQNIDIMLARVEQASQKHFFSGSLAAGLNYDSNGNSAPGNDEVLVSDFVFTLTPDSRAQSDWQSFASATFNHQYRPVAGGPWEWRSSATYFQTEQDTLDNLNLNVIIAQTGPVYRFNEGRTQADLSVGYTHIMLNNRGYLRQPSLEAGIEHSLTPQLRLRASARQEFRGFLNAPDVTTYEDRRGHATQGRLAAYYSISEQAMLDAQLTFRYEEARATQYTNLQIQPQIGLTYQWDNGIFARGLLGYRDSNYEEPDFFISQRVRHDRETTLGLTVGKTLFEDVTMTLGYDYRDTESNLSNYSYDNHRFATAIGWQF